MKLNIQTSRGMVLFAGATMVASSFVTAAPARADKANNLKIGAIVLGAIAAVKLSKGDTALGAIAGAGAYYAYKKSQDAKNDERYGYGYGHDGRYDNGSYNGGYDNNRYPDPSYDNNGSYDSGRHSNRRHSGYNDSYDASYGGGHDNGNNRDDNSYYGNDNNYDRRDDGRNDRGNVTRYPDSSYLASQGDAGPQR